MKRTINSTGRKKIPQERIAIRLITPHAGAAPSFNLDLDLKGLGLDPAALIIVEAHVASSLMRFSFGTVALLEPPPDRALTELDAGGRPLFSIKVVDDSGEVGKILAAANDISPRDPGEDDGRKPLLPLHQTDLDEELWKVHISRDTGPELHINSRIPGLADRIKDDPLLKGLVLPAAIGRVLAQLFDPEEDAAWQQDWRTFAETLEGERIDWEVDLQDRGMQIEEVVGNLLHSFCARNGWASLAIKQIEGQNDG